MEKRRDLYLGRVLDPATGKPGTTNVMYDPANLTTHAIVTGMTGSGKTGLCVGLLEEAAMQGVPALIIDPKGDLTNLLLHFPELRPEDFQPWIDPDLPRREGKDLPTLAAETAANWKKGLADWNFGRDDLIQLRDSVQYTIYTPGSKAGRPISILASFEAPNLDWSIHGEELRERISTTVTAILGLIGLTNIDPLRSREHILLSNIIENAWSQGKSLDLTELIMQTQSPPFERLGAFPVNNFFPEKDRFDLAMALNNFLASPSFQTWLDGDPLDVGKLLFTSDGHPRHSIFYISHLSDNERMFFVTLLFAAAESWMRTQTGTGGLRALIYFDEILGYLPPIANPPSRSIILRMLKQARAFGVGLLLATQNPVDVDYKALSNAGTWFVGRLQTDQDKQRLLDGLESATGAFNRSDFDKLISGLGKRVFLLHNVNKPAPVVMATRWALNYLAGPLTRTQIPALNALGGAPAASSAPAQPTGATRIENAATPVPTAAAVKPLTAAPGATLTRPAIPTAVSEFFLPVDLPFREAAQGSTAAKPEGILYRPALIAQAQVRYLARQYKLDYTQSYTSLVQQAESGYIRWEDGAWHTYDRASLDSQPLPEARFTSLPAWLSDAKRLPTAEKDFVDWVYRTGSIQVRSNPSLKLFAGPDVSTADFRTQCSDAVRAALKDEQAALETKYRQKLATLKSRISKQELEVKEKQAAVNQRRMDEVATGVELLGSLFGGRKKKLSTSLNKRRMASEAASNLEQEREDLKALQDQLAGLEDEKAAALKEIEDRWAQTVNDVNELPITPAKKDIFVELFGIAWAPYYLVRSGDQVNEIPAFRSPA